MQNSNCGRVSWKEASDGQPDCLCFASCSTVSDPLGEAGWQTYTLAEATSGSVASQDGSTAASTTTQASVAAAEAMEVGRCEGNGYSQLGFAGMDKDKCFQRVRESMQTSNCARVSWNPQKDNQPQCLCFSSCDTVDGQSEWETYTYQAATTTDSGCNMPSAVSLGLLA